jgi:hypothetical protein
MKEFNNNNTFNKNHKVLIFASFFLVYFLLKSLADWFMEDEMTWVSNLISSVVFAAIMTFLFILSNKRFINDLQKDVSSALADDERVQIEVPAGHISGIIVYGGRLILTDKRLLFFKPDFFKKTRIWTLERESIDHIKPKKIFLIADNGIEITDNSGKKYSFNMQKRDEVLSRLLQMIG